MTEKTHSPQEGEQEIRKVHGRPAGLAGRPGRRPSEEGPRGWFPVRVWTWVVGSMPCPVGVPVGGSPAASLSHRCFSPLLPPLYSKKSMEEISSGEDLKKEGRKEGWKVGSQIKKCR